MEDYAFILDYLPHGRGDKRGFRREPIAYAIGDMEFQLGCYEQARASLMLAMNSCDGATGNPFVRMRLGQAMFEPGEHTEAASWLAGAFLMEGPPLFEDEDPKYLAFVRPQLRPPVGGWPEGW